jgi:hypothetical protein
MAETDTGATVPSRQRAPEATPTEADVQADEP